MVTKVPPYSCIQPVLDCMLRGVSAVDKSIEFPTGTASYPCLDVQRNLKCVGGYSFGVGGQWAHPWIKA